MTVDWNERTVHPKEGVVLRAWQAARASDEVATAADLAHAILFGGAQDALEVVSAGGAGLTTDHARAIHFANEMAELRHYAPLISVDDDVPVLAPGVRELIERFDDLGLWQGRPSWRL